MKKLFTHLGAVSLLMLLGVTAFAQQAVLATGGEGSGAGSFSFSVGQVVYATAAAGTYSAAAGVQQAYEVSIMVDVDTEALDVSLSAYPNPTPDVLWLDVEAMSHHTLTYALHDVHGKLLGQDAIQTARTEVALQPFPAGHYLLAVYDGGTLIKSFKIIKK